LHALPTPARSATPSMVMSAKPDEVTSSLAALRIAFSVRPLRGRPRFGGVGIGLVDIVLELYRNTRRSVRNSIERTSTDERNQYGPTLQAADRAAWRRHHGGRHRGALVGPGFHRGWVESHARPGGEAR